MRGWSVLQFHSIQDTQWIRGRESRTTRYNSKGVDRIGITGCVLTDRWPERNEAKRESSRNLNRFGGLNRVTRRRSSSYTGNTAGAFMPFACAWSGAQRRPRI